MMDLFLLTDPLFQFTWNAARTRKNKEFMTEGSDSQLSLLDPYTRKHLACGVPLSSTFTSPHFSRDIVVHLKVSGWIP